MRLNVHCILLSLVIAVSDVKSSPMAHIYSLPELIPIRLLLSASHQICDNPHSSEDIIHIKTLR